MDLPPNIDTPPQLGEPSAYVVQAPECRYLTNTQAQVAFQRLKARLPGTSFDSASPSEVCGLVKVQMSSGTVVYTDPTGRFLLLTFAFDTHKGSPADLSEEIEFQIENRQRYPDTPIPGVLPGIEPEEHRLNFINK